MAKTVDDVINLLNQPLDSGRVKYREAPGSDPVPYIEGYDAINKANEIFEYRWYSKILEVRIERWERPVTKWNSQTRTKEPVMDQGGSPIYEAVGVVYVTGEVSATMGDEYYTKGDVGVNTINGPSPEALDTAIKGAATDCLKRCLRQFGEQFGNSLYDKEVRQELKEELKPGNSGQRTSSSNNAPRSNGNGSAQRPASNSGNKPAAKAAAPAVAPVAAAAPAVEVEPSAPAAPYTPEQIEEAKKVVIPTGAPLEGQTMGEAIKDKKFGAYVVLWLTGEKDNKSGRKFVPANTDDEKVQAAAKTLALMMKHEKWPLTF